MSKVTDEEIEALTDKVQKHFTGMPREIAKRIARKKLGLPEEEEEKPEEEESE